MSDYVDKKIKCPCCNQTITIKINKYTANITDFYPYQESCDQPEISALLKSKGVEFG